MHLTFIASINGWGGDLGTEHKQEACMNEEEKYDLKRSSTCINHLFKNTLLTINLLSFIVQREKSGGGILSMDIG